LLFTQYFAIPPNTPVLSPKRVWLPACEGTVTKVIVRWRWGSGNLCGCRVMYSEYQVWPRSKAQWFISNPQAYEFDENLEITDHPHFFAVEAYNLDDTFQHSVEVCVNILRKSDMGALGEFVEFMVGAEHG